MIKHKQIKLFIPKFIKEWLDKERPKYDNLYDFLEDNEAMRKGTHYLEGDNLRFKAWFNKNEDLFCKAWLFPEMIETI